LRLPTNIIVDLTELTGKTGSDMRIGIPNKKAAPITARLLGKRL
jgi:hypothetical protein